MRHTAAAVALAIALAGCERSEQAEQAEAGGRRDRGAERAVVELDPFEAVAEDEQRCGRDEHHRQQHADPHRHVDAPHVGALEQGRGEGLPQHRPAQRAAGDAEGEGGDQRRAGSHRSST